MRAAALLTAAAGVVAAFAGPGLADDGSRAVSVIRDARIPESSALTFSTRQPGWLYTINDSGNPAVVYVVAEASGRVVGTATLSGVETVDPEALAIGADDRLYVADVGDNSGVRESVALYALPQPGRGDVSVTPQSYTVRYPDGAHDAEAVITDPVDGRISILTKELFSGAVYRLPKTLDADRVLTAQRVAPVRLPGLVTDAGSLPDGCVVVRTYATALVYRLPDWEQVATVQLPPQRQGESLAPRPDGGSVLIGTEGLPSPLVEVRLPSTEAPPTEQRSAGDSPGTAEADERGARAWTAGAVGAVTLLLGVGWLLVRRAQARRSTT